MLFSTPNNCRNLRVLLVFNKKKKIKIKSEACESIRRRHLSLLETLPSKLEKKRLVGRREPDKTIRPKKGLTRTPLNEERKKKRWWGRQMEKANRRQKVELYQMEINILSLVGHQYCKTHHFEFFLFFEYWAKGHRNEAKVGLLIKWKEKEKKFDCLHELCKTGFERITSRLLFHSYAIVKQLHVK